MAGAQESNESNEFRTLIDAVTLARHLHRQDWVVVDCRHDLPAPEAGAARYGAAHVPGAAFLHMDRELSGPKTGKNGRHPLPDRGALAARLGELGIAGDTQVVAYDDVGGMMAGRLWWLLRWLGHDRVAVLDGGWPAWVAAGLPITSVPFQRTPAHFPWPAASVSALPGHREPVLVEEVLARLGEVQAGDGLILDARAPDRYRGENETLDPVGGHIPGAHNRFFRLNLDEQGRFRPPAELREAFLALLAGRPPEAVIHQCGSGVSACHNVLAMEVAGLPGSRLYAGSWSEWCSDGTRPVA